MLNIVLFSSFAVSVFLIYKILAKNIKHSLGEYASKINKSTYGFRERHNEAVSKLVSIRKKHDTISEEILKIKNIAEGKIQSIKYNHQIKKDECAKNMQRDFDSLVMHIEHNVAQKYTEKYIDALSKAFMLMNVDDKKKINRAIIDRVYDEHCEQSK